MKTLSPWLPLLAALLVLLLFPLFGSSFYVGLLIRILIIALFAMSLDLLIGFTGLVSFGHAAFFGIGAYTFAITFQDAVDIHLWQALPLSLAAAALAALIVGWISIRTSGIYFIMITLAMAQMFYYYFFETPQFGGDDGIFLFAKPVLMLGGADLLQLDNETHFYYFTLFFLVLSYLILRMILRAPFGKVIVAIKANEHRVQALGYATNRYKLVSFVIAGTLSGLAGFLEGAHSGYINPSYMSWHESGVCIAIVILGGMGTLYGPIIGAFIIVLLQNFLPEWTEHAQLVLGVIVIAVVLFLPHGVASLPARLINLLRRRTKLPDEAAKEIVDG